MKVIKDILKSSDFLGKQYQPTFRSKSLSSTLTGGFLSICFCLLVSIGTFFLGSELYKREQPLSNTSYRRHETNKVPLSHLQILFSFIDTSNRPITENEAFLRSVQISASVMQVVPDENRGYRVNHYVVPYSLCSKDILGPEIHSSFAENQLIVETKLCLNTAKMTDLEGKPVEDQDFIQNPSGTLNNSLLRIEIKKCDSLRNPGCDKYLKENPFVFVLFNLRSDFLDVVNFDNPTNFGVVAKHGKISLNQAEFSNYIYQVNSLVTDSGYIFNDKQEVTYFSLNSVSRQYTPFSEINKSLLVADFEVSMLRMAVSRHYLKVQQLLASVGGFVKAMTILLSLAVRANSEHSLYNEIRAEQALFFNKQTQSVSTNSLVEDKSCTKIAIGKKKIEFDSLSFFGFVKLKLGFKRNCTQNLETVFSCFDAKNIIAFKYRLEKVERDLKAVSLNKANKHRLS